MLDRNALVTDLYSGHALRFFHELTKAKATGVVEASQAEVSAAEASKSKTA